MSDAYKSNNQQSKNIDFLLNCNRSDCKDIQGEKALWQSVVMQAALDAMHNPSDIKERIERAKTIAWFSMQNEDFLLVCSFAEFSPELVIKGLKTALSKNKKTARRPKSRKMRQVNKVNRTPTHTTRRTTAAVN